MTTFGASFIQPIPAHLLAVYTESVAQFADPDLRIVDGELHDDRSGRDLRLTEYHKLLEAKGIPNE